MARFSQPSNARFFCWNLDNDNYNNTQLTANWDLIDAILGYPNTGTWPTSGQSVMAYIKALQLQSEPLGTLRIVQIVDASQAIPAGTGGVPDAKGYHVADGTTLTPSNHSFADSTGALLNKNITLPDYRNRIPLGADVNTAFGVAGTSGDGHAFAPGSMGIQGSNATVTIAGTLPDHYHDHSHIHEVGNTLGGNPETGTTTSNNANNGIGTAAVGTGQPIALPSHSHHFDIYSSNARLPDDGNYKVNDAPNNNSQTNRTQTSLQKVKAGGSPSDPTGGAQGDSLSVSVNADTRNASIGAVYIIKVKNIIVA